MRTVVPVKVRLWLYSCAAVSTAVLIVRAGLSTPATWTDSLSVLLLFLILIATSVAVLSVGWNIRAGRKLSGDVLLANDRLRLAMESGKTVAWDWDVVTGRDVWFGDLKTMFGLPGDTYEGRVEDFRRRVHPDDRELVWRAVAAARIDRTPYQATFRVIREDGELRWVRASGRFYYAPSGEAVRMMGIAADITDRKEIEDRLQESQERLTGIVTSAIDAIIAVDDHQRVIVFNAAAERMFGCAAGDAIGGSLERFIPAYFRASRREQIDHVGLSGVTNRTMGALNALRALRASGEEFPIEASISQVEAVGKKLFTIIMRDVTEPKKAEAALRESEERFRRMADTAPVMIWMSDTDARWTYFNRPWLDFTGRRIEHVMGSGWTASVHAFDISRCLETHMEAFERREPFRMEYRLRRHDGEYRWVLDSGVPRFMPDQRFAGYIGTAIDVTDHKLAQEALSGLGRRLIQAHEEERSWIARELHDDVIQRMSLLSVELDTLSRADLDNAGERQSRVQRVSQRLIDLTRDVQGISHRLHSSKLEYLGIVAAAEGVCKEIAEQQDVEIAFSHADVPDDLPPELSLSLFRILQEGLHNAIKHSGARNFAVALHGTAAEIRLEVCDTGVGFDAEAAMRGHGLGLISMRERMNLVNGEISIVSRPGHGTRIAARVPLVAEDAGQAVNVVLSITQSTATRAPL